MKADISRDSFDSNNNFQRVLLQQGRVLLDSDWNEQVAILLRQRQLLARGIFGSYAAPPHHPGYEVVGNQDTTENNFDKTKTEYNETHDPDITDLPKDFFIRSGLYCVDGVMIENPQVERYTKQPFYEPAELPRSAYLVFLDVWERHVTPVEFEGISDTALRGIETAHRSQLVWQVRVQPFRDAPFAAQRDASNNNELIGFTVTTGTPLDLTKEPSADEVKNFFNEFLKAKGLTPEARGKLVVSLNPPTATQPPAPSRYRGTEHRLYRVEIHQGGEVMSADTNVTFKWSRDNGSIVFPVDGREGNVVTLRAIPGDASRSPQEGSYVELLDERYALTRHISPDRHPTSRQLFKVKKVEPSGEHYRVTLEHTANPKALQLPDENYTLLRVWDHQDSKGAIAVPNLPAEGETTVPLEDGLYLRFKEGTYRTGDYWLIPARADISPQPWENGSGESRPFAPHAEHSFAPLAAIDVTETDVNRIQDLRLKVESVVVAFV